MIGENKAHRIQEKVIHSIQPPKRWELILGIIAFILGFFIVVQYRTQKDLFHLIPTRQAEEMAGLLKEAENKRLDLERELFVSRQKVMDLQSKLEQEKSKNVSIGEESKKIELLAGVTPVKGPGVIVTVKDAKNGQEGNASLVHDEDLLRIVNELRAGGAEAIGINDQRLVAISEIRCAGPVVLVNGVRLAPPFVIKGIGSSEILYNSLTMSGGIVDYLKLLGIRVSVEKSNSLYIPAFNANIQINYATLLNKGE
ncbi:DUF881 domain-containing protein [Thermodesulfobium sp. 4217-1]|uniref:DUF881 domain-containing protein n=1 Tax=Thermodesulfobium sp. 4217-1 TaxID=3120013 RepID=UPI003221B8F6